MAGRPVLSGASHLTVKPVSVMLRDLRVHRRQRRLVPVRHVDGQVYLGGLAVYRPLHLSGVGGLGLVVEGRSLRHADLSSRRVDFEQTRGRSLARQRVVQRLGPVGRSPHGGAHGGACLGVFGDVPCHVGNPANGDDLEDVPTVPVMRPVCDIGGARDRIEKVYPQSGSGAIRVYGGGDYACGRGRDRVGKRVAVGVREIVVDSLNGVASAQFQDVGGIEAARGQLRRVLVVCLPSAFANDHSV